MEFTEIPKDRRVVNINRSLTKDYRGIIFDLDGTLSRTNQLIFDTFNHVAEKYLGKRFDPSEITGMFGPPEDVAIGNLVDESDFSDAMDDFYRYYSDHHSQKAALYDGIYELLAELHDAGIKLGIFTGKGSVTTEITLNELQIKDFFPVIVTGHDVDRHKPSGEGITLALEKMGIDNNHALMVGDSFADYAAAREAGIDIASVLWDSYGFNTVITLDSDYKFFSVAEFHQWIRTLYQNNNNPTHNQ